MHIVDGVLSTPVLVGGALLTIAGVVAGLRALDAESIPRAGLLTAAFFAVSLIHVPIGPTSTHLLLTGLMGLLLGWAVFPTILAGLLLQSVFFGFGGLTVLGSNTLNLALPALLVGLAARQVLIRLDRAPESTVLSIGAVAGAAAFGLSALMVAGSLALSGREFWPAAQVALIAQSPVMLLEGMVTAAALRLVWMIRPELLAGALPCALQTAEQPQEA